MPPLSSARRRANLERRVYLNKHLRQLYNHYYGPYELGPTLSHHQIAYINSVKKELAARRIQKAVRARQARQARAAAYARAISHTRARAPLNLVMATAYNPRRVSRLRNQYGLRANNF
jgi:hypothetical protein